MKFGLKKPCDSCPFLRTDGAVRLRAGRIRDIHNVVTGSQGGSFPCHKTVKDEDREEDECGDEIWSGPRPHWQWCAGALIYALKQERPNQLMRVALRVGLLDPDELLASDAADDVFDNRAEWLVSADDYEEDLEKRAEAEPCNIVEAGCEAPAGFLTGDGVIDGEESAEFTCWHCGEPVCGACSFLDKEGENGERICVYCDERREEEDD